VLKIYSIIATVLYAYYFVLIALVVQKLTPYFNTIKKNLEKEKAGPVLALISSSGSLTKKLLK
jgi:hypothetical protein